MNAAFHLVAEGQLLFGHDQAHLPGGGVEREVVEGAFDGHASAGQDP